ncbi:hypothetical protein [Allocoprobacillus halotolerans]|nr:hypothetical protein [Allocoprobacillus halotolerans]
MQLAVPRGVSNYRRLKTDHYYFVDKSLMISDFLKEKMQSL